MAHAIPVGYRFDVNPIAPIPENTIYIPAGPLAIGIEYRLLTDELIDETYASDTRSAAIIGDARPDDEIDDQGVSLHVCDAETMKEYVRFDVFADDPHYHYIVPGEYNVVVAYDTSAFGDTMFEWAMSCLQDRLPAMLRAAGAHDLAARVDESAIAEALPTIRDEANERRQHPQAAVAS